MKFRKDINGLRALAVISVVLFHFNEIWMPGGFAGVDVFFVISGFLMTSIIFKGVGENNFSIFKFYIARANRIVPALALLCLILLVFGWIFLTPFDYKVLGKHVAGSIGFVSNFIYWREAGYFDSVSHDKWLLHTWSLAVEWQFYIIYPIIIVLLNKFFSLKVIKTLILLITFIGFGYSIFATNIWPNSSYYLLSTRAWEMMVGGIAYLYPLTITSKSKGRFFEALGLLLILSSYFFVNKESSWPGYLAFFPVFGAFLVIQSQQYNSFFTGNFIAQKIGSWSYSIYLWHWPIVVAIYYFNFGFWSVYVGILLSFVLGFISYNFVERIRFDNYFPSMYSLLVCKPLQLSIVVASLSSAIFLFGGLSFRFQVDSNFASIENGLTIPLRSNGYCFYSLDDNNYPVDKDAGVNCTLGLKGDPSSSLLFGDSYAGHNEPFLDEIFKNNKQSLQSIVTNWCFPSTTTRYTGPITHSAYKQCLLNREYLNENMQNYKNIIFAASWDSVLRQGLFDDVESVIDRAANLGINVFVIAGPYRFSKNPLSKFYRSVYFNQNFDISSIEGNDELMTTANMRLKTLSEKYKNVHFWGRDILYERKNVFSIGALTVPYSLDGGHISLIGSKYSAKYFMQDSGYQKNMSYFDFN
ncbi:acyltransferase family protein [Shewanella frigidimarina]|uniref:acyltransferase family protein n=1 Tax=Shewanella frigidimarina TaxID=56812 RepID=UPI003D797F66